MWVDNLDELEFGDVDADEAALARKKKAAAEETMARLEEEKKRKENKETGKLEGIGEENKKFEEKVERIGEKAKSSKKFSSQKSIAVDNLDDLEGDKTAEELAAEKHAAEGGGEVDDDPFAHLEKEMWEKKKEREGEANGTSPNRAEPQAQRASSKDSKGSKGSGSGGKSKKKSEDKEKKRGISFAEDK